MICGREVLRIVTKFEVSQLRSKINNYSHHDEGSFYFGTIIRTRITCKKIPLLKSIEFGIALKKSAAHNKQKVKIFLITRPLTCSKLDFYFFLFYYFFSWGGGGRGYKKGQKEDKCEFMTKSAGTVRIIFM